MVLSCIAAFSFENFLRTIKKNVQSPNNPVIHIAKKVKKINRYTPTNTVDLKLNIVSAPRGNC